MAQDSSVDMCHEVPSWGNLSFCVMLCCYHPDIYNAFSTRGPGLSFTLMQTTGMATLPTRVRQHFLDREQLLERDN